jgi:hypothetical protein
MTNTVKIYNNEMFLNEEKIFSSEGNTSEFIAAAYKYFQINYPKFYKMDLMSKLGIVATEIIERNFPSKEENPFLRSILLQNKQASLYADKKYAETLDTIPSPALFVYTLPNIVMGEIAIKYGYKGENTFFVAEKFNPSQLEEYGNILLSSNITTELLMGFIDFSDTEQELVIWKEVS